MRLDTGNYWCMFFPSKLVNYFTFRSFQSVFLDVRLIAVTSSKLIGLHNNKIPFMVIVQ